MLPGYPPETVQDWLDIINSITLDPSSSAQLSDLITSVTDEDILRQLGLRLSDPTILSSLFSLTPDHLLVELLDERSNPEVRLLLAKAIESNSIRRELFHTQTDDDIRSALLLPLLRDKDYELDSEKMIRSERSPGIRSLLISYLNPTTHQSLLFDIVLGDEHIAPRREAAALIDDQDMVKTILAKEQNGEVRYSAVQHLEDERLLTELAQHDLYWRVRQEALSLLDDDDLLVKAAASDPSIEIRLYCIERINDPDLLASIAMNENNPVLRKRAVELILNIQDTDTLLNIALEESDPVIKALAISQIDNQQILGKIIQSSRVTSVRKAAIGRLTDVDILIGLMREMTNLKLQRAIINRLAEQQEIITLELLEAETMGSLRELIRQYLSKLY